MKYQWVRGRLPTETPSLVGAKNGNAVAGVKARDGVDQTGSGIRTRGVDKSAGPVLASALAVVLGHQGRALGLALICAQPRTLLRESCA